MAWLSGKKTYITAAAGAVIMGLFYAGVIDAATRDTLLAFCGVTAVATLRAAITKSGPPTSP